MLKLKRVFDVTVVLLFSPLFFVLFILVLLLVKMFIGSPVIFKQKRPGLNARIFTLYKFRTMSSDKDFKGDLLPDENRLNRFGKFLRSTSLDEVPSLFNVFRGDMSLVGPRPLLIEYLPLYSKRQAIRHRVKPGITGWAQVNGRNAITWEEKFNLDIWYVENQSIFLDIRILILTIIKTIRRDGITAPGSATVDYFKGNKNEE